MADKRLISFIAAAAAVLLTMVGAAVSLSLAGMSSSIDVSDFSSVGSSKALPAHWKIRTFPSIDAHTQYTVVEDRFYGPVVQARAAASAAGLVRRINVDPQEYPMLSWAWKISGTLKGSSLKRKGGDDFPARLLVSFSGDLLKGSAIRTLCYVWARNESVGTMSESPYNSDVVTIVASSGDSQANNWQEVRRDIVKDYLQAFGQMPGALLAISLLSDSDNTGEFALAWYGPISLNR